MNVFTSSFNTCFVSIMFLSFFMFSSISNATVDEHKDDIVYGNVICLLPDYATGNVKPIIANENCSGHAPHAHVVLDTRSKVGNVYAVQGSPEAIERIQSLKKKTNVAVKGKISGDQRAWILTVE